MNERIYMKKLKYTFVEAKTLIENLKIILSTIFNLKKIIIALPFGD